MVFRSIGFEARLILNKMQNERLIKEQKPDGQADRQEDNRTKPDAHREQGGDQVVVK